MNDTQIIDQIVSDIDNSPWYQSTQGQKLSQTVCGIAALVLPVFQTMFPGHITTGIDWIDRAINVLMIIGFGIYSLVGYARAKNILGTKIKTVAQLIPDQTQPIVNPDVVPTPTSSI